MNNDITMRPAYLGGSEVEGAFADQLGFVRPARVSLNDPFTLIDENGEQVRPKSVDLMAILLWENDTRIYYPKGDYDPDNAIPPTCYSDNRVTPSEGAMQPQSEFCANCPRAVRDQPSFKGTTLVSACAQRYKLAILVSGAGKKVFLLDIAPGSRKPYERYRAFLKQHHALPYQVLTKLTYDGKAKQLGFDFQGWVAEALAPRIMELMQTDEPAMIVNATDRPRQTALPKPEAKAMSWGPNGPAENDAAALKGTPWEKPDPDFEGVKAGSRVVPMMQGERLDPPREFAPLEDRAARPATVVEAPKRRGRPPKDAASAGPSTPPPSAPVQRDMFLHDPTTVNHNPAPTSSFGMEPAQSPDRAMQEALERAFGP